MGFKSRLLKMHYFLRRLFIYFITITQVELHVYYYDLLYYYDSLLCLNKSSRQ